MKYTGDISVPGNSNWVYIASLTTLTSNGSNCFDKACFSLKYIQTILQGQIVYETHWFVQFQLYFSHSY